MSRVGLHSDAATAQLDESFAVHVLFPSVAQPARGDQVREIVQYLRSAMPTIDAMVSDCGVTSAGRAGDHAHAVVTGQDSLHERFRDHTVTPTPT